MSRDVIGIAWYRREDFDWWQATAEDRDVFDDTYEEWLERARRTCREMLGRGTAIERVDLDPKEFTEWCRSQDIKMNGEARSRFAAEYVRRKYGPAPE